MISLLYEDSTRKERQGNNCRSRLLRNVENRLKILDWISRADFRSRHETVSKERVKNSGTWFIKSDPFQNWLKGAAPNILCYQGIRRIFTQIN